MFRDEGSGHALKNPDFKKYRITSEMIHRHHSLPDRILSGKWTKNVILRY